MRAAHDPSPITLVWVGAQRPYAQGFTKVDRDGRSDGYDNTIESVMTVPITEYAEHGDGS